MAQEIQFEILQDTQTPFSCKYAPSQVAQYEELEQVAQLLMIVLQSTQAMPLEDTV